MLMSWPAAPFITVTVTTGTATDNSTISAAVKCAPDITPNETVGALNVQNLLT